MKRSLSVFALLVITCFATRPASGGNIVTDWNQIASTTIVKNAGNGPAASAVWFAYASIAAYDAVNAITLQYRQFYYHASGPATASVDAAVAAAYHRVLVNYFPSQKTDLDTTFSMYLTGLSGDSSARDAGVAVGEASAAALIAARTGDGLNASITYTPGTGPGAWVPTPPTFGSPVTPWVGQMRPFTMATAADFLPDGPTPLTSEAWKRDYTLTRLLGGTTSTIRSASETEIAIFWTEQTAQQYARTLAYLINNYGLSVPESARLIAMVWTATADAAIACYNAKYTYGFWRPVTAIPASGGNPDLTADASWSPLGITPLHPEYPAGHACLTGGAATATAGYFGTTRVHLVIDSLAFTDGLHTHTFEDTRDWMDEVIWARIFAGFHYLHSVQDGNALGAAVAQELVRHHFRKIVPAP